MNKTNTIMIPEKCLFGQSIYAHLDNDFLREILPGEATPLLPILVPIAMNRFFLSIISLSFSIGLLFAGLPPSAAAQPLTFEVSTADFSNPLPTNEASTITVDIVNHAEALNNALIDMEIYTLEGVRVFQHIDTPPESNLPTEVTQTFSFEWTPQTQGLFILKLGIFDRSWSQEPYYWNDYVGLLAVGEPAGTADVTMKAAWLTTQDYYLSSQAVVNVAFRIYTTPPSRPVIIDLELYNHDTGQQVAQKIYENVILSDTESDVRTLEIPKTLPAGTYVAKVGIFSPGWEHLLHWYDNAFEVDLGAAGSYEDDVVLIGSTNINPNSVSAGSSSQLSVSVFSPNTTNHVLIDLELYNKAGQKVVQTYFDNIAIPKAGTGNYQDVYSLFTPTNLPSGTYTFKAGLFHPGWNGLIEWYNYIGALTIE